ncbi:hypothetical protein EDEG_00750, partial [Edhazardia aedis USNM 41457]
MEEHKDKTDDSVQNSKIIFDINKIDGQKRKQIEPNNSSSFIEIPFLIHYNNDFSQEIVNMRTKNSAKSEIHLTKNKTEYKDCTQYGTIPSFYDPIFYPYIIEIPFNLFKIIKDTSKISFSYKICDCSTFRIKKDGLDIYLADIVEFNNNNFDHIINSDTKNLFILNRRSFIVWENKQNLKEYKNSLTSGFKYREIKNSEAIQNRLIKLQIKYNINVYFIETLEDILLVMKSIITVLKNSVKSKIKVKTFKEENKNDYLNYAISKIPGLGMNVAKFFSSRYKSLKDFYCFLSKQSIKSLSKLKIGLESANDFRELGEKQAALLLKAFTSSDGDSRFLD